MQCYYFLSAMTVKVTRPNNKERAGSALVIC